MDISIIAIISASSAILGAVITQITTYLISKSELKEKRKIFLREKYEEFTNQIIESEIWLINLLKERDRLEVVNYPSSAKSANSLSLIYFPELKIKTAIYVKSLNDLQTYIFSRKSIKQGPDDEFKDLIQKHRKEYLPELEKEIENHAEKYTIS